MHKANPSLEYMPALQLELEQAWLRALEDPDEMPEFRTKRCNLPDVPPTAKPLADWKDILRCSYLGTTMAELELKNPRQLPERRGKSAIIALDYADIRDFASLGVLTADALPGRDPVYSWTQHTWISSNNPDFAKMHFPFANIGQIGFQDFEVGAWDALPAREIVIRAVKLMEEYNIRKIVMDTYRFVLFEELFKEYGLLKETPQNKNGMIRLIRRYGSVSSIVIPYMQSLFVKGNIVFGDSAIMRWYVNNTGLSMDGRGNLEFIKVEPRYRKNDGLSAMAIAFFCKDLLEEQVFYI